MDRRGFLKLAGVASTALYLSKYAILPAKAAPHPDFDPRVAVLTDRVGCEMGLITEGTTELEAPWYWRVVPELLENRQADQHAFALLRLRGSFPMARGRGAWTVTRIGLYEPKGGLLLYWQDLNDRISLREGTSIQADADLGYEDNLTASAMKRLLGIKV
jgi:hypothetical protein